MKRIVILFSAFFLLALVTSCAKCTVTGCSDITQTQMDAAINNNAAYNLLGDTYKKAGCDSYTSIQSFYGTGCKIAWQ